MRTYTIQAFHASGRSGVCTVGTWDGQGIDGTPSADLAIREAWRLVRECGYAKVTLEVSEQCDTCGGTGRVVKPSKRPQLFARHIGCPSCKGKDSERALIAPVVVAWAEPSSQAVPA